MKQVLPIFSLVVIALSSCGESTPIVEEMPKPPATMNLLDLTQALWTSWEETDVAGTPVFYFAGENIPGFGNPSFSLPIQFQNHASSFSVSVDLNAMKFSGLPLDVMTEIPDFTGSEVGMKASLASGMHCWGTNLPEVDDVSFFTNAQAWKKIWDLLVRSQAYQMDVVTGEVSPEEFAEALMTLIDSIQESPNSEEVLTELSNLIGNEFMSHATLHRSDLGDHAFRYSASLGDLWVDMIYGSLEKLPWAAVTAKLEAEIPDEAKSKPEGQAVLKWLREDLPHYPKSKYQAFADAMEKGMDMTLQYDLHQREDGSLFATAYLIRASLKDEDTLHLAANDFIDAFLDFMGDVIPAEKRQEALAMKEGLQENSEMQAIFGLANLSFSMSMATPDGFDFRPIPESAFTILEAERETADDVSMQVEAFLPMVEMTLREAGAMPLESESLVF